MFQVILAVIVAIVKSYVQITKTALKSVCEKVRNCPPEIDKFVKKLSAIAAICFSFAINGKEKTHPTRFSKMF